MNPRNWLMTFLMLAGACGQAAAPDEEPSLEGTTLGLIAPGTLGEFHVRNGSGLAMSVAGNGTANSSLIQLGAGTGGDVERITVVKVNTNDVELHVNGKCVDVSNAVLADGSRLWLWPCSGNSAQRFRLENTSGTPIKLAANSGLCIGPQNNGATSGTQLQLQTCNASSHQAWSLSTIAATPSDAGSCQDDSLLTRFDPASQACAGHWEYKRIAQCTLTNAEACGTSPSYPACSHWDHGADDVADSGRVYSFTVPEACRRVTECNEAGNCFTRIRCDVDTAAAARLCTVQTDAYIAQQRALTDDRYDARIRITSGPSFRYGAKVGNSYPNSSCTVSYITVIPTRKPSPVCTPVTYVPNTCTARHVNCGLESTAYLSEPYQTRQQVLDMDMHAGFVLAAPLCTSCKSLPVNTPEAVRAKYDCLRASYDGRSTAHFSGKAANPVEIRPGLIRDLRLLYERHGQHLTADARAFVRDLYVSAPDEAHLCTDASDAEALRLPDSCPSAERALPEAEFARCQRLTESGVPEAALALEVESCFSAFERMLAFGDEHCGSAELRDQVYEVATAFAHKALSHYGDGSAATATVARALYGIDRWYRVAEARVQRGVVEDVGDESPAPGTTPGLSGPFGDGDDADAGVEDGDAGAADAAMLLGDQRDAELSRLFGRFWTLHHARNNTLASLVDRTDQEAAIREVTERGMASDRQVLLATYPRTPELPEVKLANGTVIAPRVALEGTTLHDAPLLLLTADALAGLRDRLADLGMFHDFACRVLDCRGVFDTDLADLWSLLGNLNDRAKLAQALSGTGTLSGWKEVFDAMLQHHARLENAAETALGDASFEDAPVGAWPRRVAPFAELIAEASDHANAYAHTGQFRPVGRVLSAGLNQSQRQRISQTLLTQAGELGQASERFEAGLDGLITGFLGMRENERARAALLERANLLAARYDAMNTDMEGLAKNMQLDTLGLASLVTAYRDIEGAMDEGSFIRLKEPGTQHLRVTGASARFDANQPYSLVRMGVASTPVEVPAQHFLALSASGTYAPTCSVSQASVLDGRGNSAPLDTRGVEVGPEGFMLTRSDGYALLDSFDRSETDSSSFSRGFRADLCVTGGFSYPPKGGPVSFGAELKACVYAEQNWTDSTQERESYGWSRERRESAAFAAGLRLPNTPFPEMPAGALLAVVVPRNETDVRRATDIQVVTRPDTAILVKEDSDVYFVVNDLRCDRPDASGGVQMSYGILQPNSLAAEAAVSAMAETLEAMRQERDKYARQGALLSSDTVVMRSDASLALQSRLDQLDIAELPAPLKTLFAAFVDREVAAVERSVRLLQMLRESRELSLEMEHLFADHHRVGQIGRLGALLPSWKLRNLDGDSLRTQAGQTLTTARQFLLPVLEVWFSGALQQLRHGPEGQTLRNQLRVLQYAGLDSWTPDLVNTAVTSLQALIGTYANGAPGDPDSPYKPIIAVSFPNQAGIIVGRDGSQVETDMSELPKVEMEPETDELTRAERIWSALYGYENGTFVLRPDDIYRSGGLPGELACNEGTPVIERMALMVIVNDASSEMQEKLDALNQGRFVSGRSSPEQTFQGETGPLTYELRDARWQNFVLPVIYANHLLPLDAFRNLMLDDRATRPDGALGLSPFGSFTVDFAPFARFAGTPSGDGLEQAVELALVMQVSTQDINAMSSDVVSSCGN